MTDHEQADMIDWTARHAAVVAADGDEWDRLSEAYDADWKATYEKVFVEHALSRRWDRANAEVWANEIVDDVLIERRGDDPADVARADVMEAEHETSPD